MVGKGCRILWGAWSWVLHVSLTMVSSYSQLGRWGMGGQLGSGEGRGLGDRTDTTSLHPEL